MANKKQIAAAAVGVVGNLALWRIASHFALGSGLPGTAVAVTGLALASVCDKNDPDIHCRAGKAINAPGNFVGTQAMNALGKGSQMLNKGGEDTFGLLPRRR